MDALRLNGLAKEFGDLVAVDRLSFAVESGEQFGLLGTKRYRENNDLIVLLGLQRREVGAGRFKSAPPPAW